MSNVSETKQLLDTTIQIRDKFLSLRSTGAHESIEKEMLELEKHANDFFEPFFEKNTSLKITKPGDWLAFLSILYHLKPELLVNLDVSPLLDRFKRCHNTYVSR